MSKDPIADLLTRIRNASRAGHKDVELFSSKKLVRVLEVLKAEGFIAAFLPTVSDQGHPMVKIVLSYHEDSPVIREIKRLSSPGRRIYSKVEEIPVFRSGLGTVIVSTSRGMMTDRQARKSGLGGELVCEVF